MGKRPFYDPDKRRTAKNYKMHNKYALYAAKKKHSQLNSMTMKGPICVEWFKRQTHKWMERTSQQPILSWFYQNYFPNGIENVLALVYRMWAGILPCPMCMTHLRHQKEHWTILGTRKKQSQGCKISPEKSLEGWIHDTRGKKEYVHCSGVYEKRDEVERSNRMVVSWPIKVLTTQVRIVPNHAWHVED